MKMNFQFSLLEIQGNLTFMNATMNYEGNFQFSLLEILKAYIGGPFGGPLHPMYSMPPLI